MKSIRRENKRGDAETTVAMTPMIDVVFLLLIFLIVTIKPVDVIAHLDVNRPSTSAGPGVPMLRVDVQADGFMLNHRRQSFDQLSTMIARLAAISTEQSVLVTCHRDSAHADLIRVLDLCAHVGLDRLSIASAADLVH